MYTTKHDTTCTDTIFSLFFSSELSHTYLPVAEILPLTPTAELCASLMDNSTTFGILELGALHGNQHFHQCLVRSRHWQILG